MSEVFITGAAGFIGFHLARFLHQRGDRVVGYDNFNPYYDVKLKRDRAEELKKMGITVLEGDICDFEALNKAISHRQTTHLIHLAAQAGVRYSIQNPRSYIKSNVEGFLNILEYCRHHLKTKLIYASSSSVYGTNHKIPFSVEDHTDQPASLYGATKKTNELMAYSYHHLFGIPVTGLRFFTVYGPWGRPDMAYSLFTRAILQDQPIEIFNQGKMKRDFTYIDDIVDGIAAAMDGKDGCRLYNLGNHKSEELLHLIALIEKELGKKAQKILLPMQPGDVVSTFADIDTTTTDLGFVPKVSLEEGIHKFIQWYKEYYR